MVAVLSMGSWGGWGCGGGNSGPDSGSGDNGDGDNGGGDGPGSIRDIFGTGGSGLPRSDASTEGDPIPPCLRFDQFGCGAGQKCAIVIRRAPGEDGFGVYNGCVDVFKERGLGAPCVQWSVEYAVAGLADEVFLDPCEQGLYCAADPSVPGLTTCQQSCQSGRYQGLEPRACDGAGDYCSTVEGNPYLEWCVESAGCDPTDTLACGEGQGCFLRPGDQASGADAALSECYPTFEPAVPDGELCQFINDCNPGSLCWGPVRVPPARWEEAEILCRPTCLPTDGDGDGGVDDGGMDPMEPVDAGGLSSCPLGQTCVPFGESGLELGTIDANFGQCE